MGTWWHNRTVTRRSEEIRLPGRVLYLMCGLAFSGKTTLARAIAERFSLINVSLDEINAERGLPPGGEGLPPEEWERSHAIAEKRLAAAFASARGAVLDDTGCFRWLRDRYRNLAGRHSVPTTVVFLDLPVEEVRARIAENARHGRRAAIDDAVFARHVAEFERPEPNERAVRFAPSDEIQSWIIANLASG